MRFLVLIIFVLTSLFSCGTKELAIQLPISDSKPVVIGFINTTDSVDIYVGRSYPPQGKVENMFIKNAKIDILENSKIISKSSQYLLNGLNRVYLNKKPTVNNSYSIKVDVPDLGNCSSNQDKMSLQTEIVNFSFNKSTNKLNINFKDNDITENNYFIIYKEFFVGDFRVPTNSNYSDIFDEKKFENKIKEYEIDVFPSGSYRGEDGRLKPYRATKARVVFAQISKPTFDYFQSLLNFEGSRGISSVEPPIVKNNIENGYGFFGTFASSFITINY
jgi:hypothetical protein